MGSSGIWWNTPAATQGLKRSSRTENCVHWVGLRFLAGGEIVFQRSGDEDCDMEMFCQAVGSTDQEKAEKARHIAAVLQTHAEVSAAYPLGSSA
jgi:hypothetical protein